ncbi:MAG: hypothetical protein ACKVS8_05620 [Phycisphaerales bacterium]
MLLVFGGLVGSATAQPPLTAPAPGQPDQAITRPDAAGRVVRFFDFEERADPTSPTFNPEPVPRGWFRAQTNPPARERPGYPANNQAAYDHTRARNGRVSIRLPTRGGSTALRLGGSTLPVFAGADYVVSAHVRTDGLVHARAAVSAQFLDGRGSPINGTLRRSTLVLTLPAAQAWTPVTVSLPGLYTDAAFIQIELLLLQPEQFLPASIAGPQHVWKQDFAGAASFDDVGVFQAPKVSLEPASGQGLTISENPPQAPLLTAIVRDLTGEPMSAVLTLKDIDDQPLARESRKLPAGGGQFSWSPELPRPGWYHAQMALYADEMLIGTHETAVLWMRPHRPEDLGMPRPSHGQAERFSLAFSALHPAQYAQAGVWVRSLGMGAATIPLWSAGEREVAHVNQRAAFRTLIDGLLRDSVSVCLWLSSVSPELAQRLRIDPGDPLALVALDRKEWLPALLDILDQYGQRINQWQIGSAGQRDHLLSPLLGQRVAPFREVLAKLVPGPMLSVPWRAEWPWPDAGMRAGIDTLILALPREYQVAAIPDAVARWRAETLSSSVATGRLTVEVEHAQPDLFGRRAAANDLARRAITLWAALGDGADTTLGRQPARLQLTDPWHTGADAAGRGVPLPEPTAAVWRTLVAHLAPRKVVGELPAPSGVRCYILSDTATSGTDGTAGVQSGALALWNESADPASAVVSAYLGLGKVHAVDLFGNVRPLTPGDGAGMYRIAAESTPVFIEGIDPNLALFVQGFKVEPEFVPSVAAEHERTLTLTNPWPVRISGDVLMVPPGTSRGASAARGWRFTPSSAMPFSISPGQTQRLPFAFSFSASEEAGPHLMNAIVRLSADRPYPPLRLSAPIMIGLKDLDVSTTAILGPGPAGPDVIVIATATNSGTSSRTLQVDAAAPGQAAQRQPISNLAPGETAVRRFGFPGAARALAGKRVRISVSDAEGTERLTNSVAVP